MTHRKTQASIAGGLTAGLSLLLAAFSPAAAGPGVVVEAVEPGRTGARAGIAPGDLLLSWRSTGDEPGGGTIHSPAELLWVELAHSPLGTVTIEGLRGTESRRWEPSSDRWGLTVRPAFDPALLAGYDEAKRARSAGRIGDGIEMLRELAGGTRNAEHAGWLLAERARWLTEASEGSRSRAAWDQAAGGADRRPDSFDTAAVRWSQGHRLKRLGRYREAGEILILARQHVESRSPDGLAVAAAYESIADVATALSDLKPAREHYRRALEIREALAPGSLAMARSLAGLGRVARKLSELAEAEQLLERSLGLFDRAPFESLDATSPLNDLGILFRTRGELESAGRYHLRALELAERLAPDSLELGTTLNGLGILAWVRGDLDEASGFHRRALEIRRRQIPGGLDVSKSLVNLGLVVNTSGDLAASESLFRQAVAIMERLVPGSLELSNTLSNLATVLTRRGDLAAAQELNRRVLEIAMAVAPEGVEVAGTLNNMAAVEIDRADWASAQSHLERALAIWQRVVPNGTAASAALCNLGQLAQEAGNLEVAEDYIRRCMEVRKRLAPQGEEVALAHRQLGKLAAARGERQVAEREYRLALAILERVAPGGLEAGTTLHYLGQLAMLRGDLETSRRLHARALAIRGRLNPDSLQQALSFRELARVAVARGERESALELQRRAIETLEAQSERLGGRQQARAGFTAEYQSYYQEMIEWLLELGREDEAFHYLERSRARTLLALLGERDLDLGAEIASDLDADRRRAMAEYDSVQNRLGQLDPVADRVEVDRLLARQRELLDRFARVKSEILKRSPRVAALRYPQPLTLEDARRELDPGTLLLSYFIAEESGWLFVIRSADEHPGAATDPAPGLEVHSLPVGKVELGRRISILRSLIERGRDGTVDPALIAQGQRLCDLLIGPVLARGVAPDRLLISADGALHTLPFGALICRIPEADEPQFLAEWKPYHTVISATVYRELRRARRERVGDRSPRLVAFGDPELPPSMLVRTDTLRDPRLRSTLASQRGPSLAALPHSREEVSAIAELYGEGAEAYVGGEATEERVKAVAGKTEILHFACHSVLDERSPLNSALVLKLDDSWALGVDNGLLQAWEIFETLRLDADLVALSACETALGKEVGGEGLMGLARAFQFAGARSILASLWRVSDRSTTELMKRFYRGLKDGMTKDEALRAAQLDLIHGRAGTIAAAPFHWAGFELIGDWQ